MLKLADGLFYFLSSSILLGGLGVILMANPIYSALFLAITMVAIGALFFLLGAYFLAGVQLIVYAGAVMVLFVMVVMLFDLKRESDVFSKGRIVTILKMVGIGGILGSILGGVELGQWITSSAIKEDETINATKQMAAALFSKHIFSFEIISVLLLVVIVGAVTLARSKGGTHA